MAFVACAASVHAEIAARLDIQLVDGCYLTGLKFGYNYAEQSFPVSLEQEYVFRGIEFQLLDFDTRRVLQDWSTVDFIQNNPRKLLLNLKAPMGCYRILLRDASGGGAILFQDLRWVVAPVVLLIGQSPMAYFHSSFGVIGSDEEARLLISSPTRPGLVSGKGRIVAEGLRVLYSAYKKHCGGNMPIVVICAAVGGSSSRNWAEKQPKVWLPMIRALESVGNPQHVFVIWLNGASDATYSKERIFANHDTIYSNLNQELSARRNIQFTYAIVPHNRDTGGFPDFMHKVRNAQMQWVLGHSDYGKNVFIAAQWFDMQTNVECLGIVLDAGPSKLHASIFGSTAPARSYLKCELAIISGKATGERANVTGFNPDTSEFSFSSELGAIPEKGDHFFVAGRSPHPSHSVMGVGRLGDRLAAWLCASVGSIESINYPEIQTVEWARPAEISQLSVKVRHFRGRQLRTLSGSRNVAGFEVSYDGGTSWTPPLVAEIVGSDQVMISLSHDKVRPALIRLRYLYGTPIASGLSYKLRDLLYDDSGVGSDGGLPVLFTLGSLQPTEY